MTNLKLTNNNIQIGDELFINPRKNKIYGSLVDFDNPFITFNNCIGVENRNHVIETKAKDAGLKVNRGGGHINDAWLKWDENSVEWQISEDNQNFYKVWHQGNLIGTKNTITKWEEENLIGPSKIREDTEGYVAIDASIERPYKLKLNGNLKVDGNTIITGTVLSEKGVSFKEDLLVDKLTSTTDLYVRDGVVLDLRGPMKDENGDPMKNADGETIDKKGQGLRIQRSTVSFVEFGWNEDKKAPSDEKNLKWYVTELSGKKHTLWHNNDFYFTGEKNVLPKWDSEEKGLVSSLVKDDGKGIGICAEPQLGYSLKVNGLVALADPLTSFVGHGTAPFIINSKTMVENLNADLLDGFEAAELAKLHGSNREDFQTKNLKIEEDVEIFGNLWLESQGQLKHLFIDDKGYVRVVE